MSRHQHSRAHVRTEAARHRRRRVNFLVNHDHLGNDRAYLVYRATTEKDRTVCSCSLCGNPRRVRKAGDPLQAIRADMAVAQEGDW